LFSNFSYIIVCSQILSHNLITVNLI